MTGNTIFNLFEVAVTLEQPPSSPGPTKYLQGGPKVFTIEGCESEPFLSEPSETDSIRQSFGCKTLGARHTQTVNSKSS